MTITVIGSILLKDCSSYNNVAPVQPNILEVNIEALASILSSGLQGTASAKGFKYSFRHQIIYVLSGHRSVLALFARLLNEGDGRYILLAGARALNGLKVEEKFTLFVEILEARDLKAADKNGQYLSVTAQLHFP